MLMLMIQITAATVAATDADDEATDDPTTVFVTDTNAEGIADAADTTDEVATGRG